MLQSSPSAVIGAGRVGRAISRMAKPACPVYGRGMDIPLHLKGPIWLCTTNDGLEDVVQRVHNTQHKQLIFIQNGMLLPLLASHGLEQSTQVLLYMSAHDDGTVTDGTRTAAYGPNATHVQQLLHQGGVKCQVMHNWEEYSSAMVVKLLWASIFWLLSAALGGMPVGHVVEQHGPAVESLVSELLPIAQKHIRTYNSSACSSSTAGNSSVSSSCMNDTSPGMPPPLQQGNRPDRSSYAGQLLDDVSAVVDELNTYSLAIAAAVPSAQMARQEFAWRNGWFLSQQPTHCHIEWLQRAGCHDLLEQYRVA